jgi:hypothetical protein
VDIAFIRHNPVADPGAAFAATMYDTFFNFGSYGERKDRTDVSMHRI